MLALVSPAKKLDFENRAPLSKRSLPQFQTETQELVKILRTKSKSGIQNLMSLSDKLADLNYSRYQSFESDFTPNNSKQAAYAFTGDTYIGLNAGTLSEDDMAFAQNHLAILSGLYGLLRPLDLMQPYRLEMGTKLANDKGKDLYNFWGDKITPAVNKAIENHKDKSVINLASNEYIKAVKTGKLSGTFITCDFKDVKKGVPKTIGLLAKRARGAMARYMIQNRIETPEGLKGFDTDGYVFQPKMSDERMFVFLRDQEN